MFQNNSCSPSSQRRFPLFRLCCSNRNKLSQHHRKQGAKEADSKGLFYRLSKQDIIYLATTFAPEIRLHENEKYLPASVTWYLHRCMLMFNPNVTKESGSPRCVLKRIKSGAQLVGQRVVWKNKIYSSDLNLQHPSPTANKSPFYLKVIDEQTYHGQRVDDLDSVPAYVHVVISQDGKELDLQYYLFFCYNGPLIGNLPTTGVHEGDWEHVTVRLRYKDVENLLSAKTETLPAKTDSLPAKTESLSGKTDSSLSSNDHQSLRARAVAAQKCEVEHTQSPRKGLIRDKTAVGQAVGFSATPHPSDSSKSFPPPAPTSPEQSEDRRQVEQLSRSPNICTLSFGLPIDCIYIRAIFMARHGNEGMWYTRPASSKDGSSRDGYVLSENTHVVVYAAKYSHASYPWSGIQKRFSFGFLDEETSDSGYHWQTWKSLTFLDFPDLPQGEDICWNRFCGRFGGHLPSIFSVNSSPIGPACKRYFLIGDTELTEQNTCPT